MTAGMFCFVLLTQIANYALDRNYTRSTDYLVADLYSELVPQSIYDSCGLPESSNLCQQQSELRNPSSMVGVPPSGYVVNPGVPAAYQLECDLTSVDSEAFWANFAMENLNSESHVYGGQQYQV